MLESDNVYGDEYREMSKTVISEIMLKNMATRIETLLMELGIV